MKIIFNMQHLKTQTNIKEKIKISYNYTKDHMLENLFFSSILKSTIFLAKISSSFYSTRVI